MWRWIFVLSTLQVNFIFGEKFQDLQFLFVNGDTPTQFEAFYFNETSKLLSHPDFDVNSPTMLYCYGFTENLVRNSTQTVLKAYISRGGYNILVLEWSKFNGGNYYFEATPNSQIVGDEVGKKLWSMKSEGFDLDSFELVGHSLGGQVVGFIGRSVYKQSSNTYKLPKLIALDPAGPFFYGFIKIFNKPLNKNDAQVVHVIHTDSNFYGAPFKSGHADFWPNGGRNQPGCKRANFDMNDENSRDEFIKCSHRRSYRYFAESVRSTDQKTFKAVPCASWRDFIQNKCPENETDNQGFMGIDGASNLLGDFFLQTNQEPPFNRGPRGIFYDETIDDAKDEFNSI